MASNNVAELSLASIKLNLKRSLVDFVQLLPTDSPTGTLKAEIGPLTKTTPLVR